jgi:16S rRNA (cytidine1402-2'-O)-methyltransferase
MSPPGTLYLIPSSLGTGAVAPVLSRSVLDALAKLTAFIVENPKSARAFLKAAGYPRALQGVEFLVCDEHTSARDVAALIRPLLEGKDCGLMSEAGCPGVADPGANVVRLAHEHGIRVVPLVGPSAILLALMASGLEGQRFAFHGYLPVEPDRRRAALVELERDSRRERRTGIFIEAPYRNMQLLRAILEACQGATLLCLATDLTLPTESIATRTVAQWKARTAPDINRRPTVFLLSCGTE